MVCSPKIIRFLKENVYIKVLSSEDKSRISQYHVHFKFCTYVLWRIRTKISNILWEKKFFCHNPFALPQPGMWTLWSDCYIDSIIRLTDVHLTSSCHPHSTIIPYSYHPFYLPQSGLRCARHRSQYFGDKWPSPHPLPHSEITLITFH